MASDLYTQMHRTATDFVHSYDQDKCGADIKALSRTLTPDCRRYFAPGSLVAQLPVLAKGRSNEEYEAQQEVEQKGAFSSWTTEVKDITVDEHGQKTVVHSCHHCVAKKDGKTVYPFEFVFTLFMTEDGNKVQKIVQFTDTGMAAKFLSEQSAVADDVAKSFAENRA